MAIKKTTDTTKNLLVNICIFSQRGSALNNILFPQI